MLARRQPGVERQRKWWKTCRGGEVGRRRRRQRRRGRRRRRAQEAAPVQGPGRRARGVLQDAPHPHSGTPRSIRNQWIYMCCCRTPWLIDRLLVLHCRSRRWRWRAAWACGRGRWRCGSRTAAPGPSSSRRRWTASTSSAGASSWPRRTTVHRPRYFNKKTKSFRVCKNILIHSSALSSIR